jgi:hypothetical protein
VKKILVVTYSQSGQLNSIVANVIKALQGNVQIHWEHLKPLPDYPFPWKDIQFWDAQPECVEMIPSKLEPFGFNSYEDFDLIILGYPIWFLSPPIPLTTFLKSDEARLVMKGKPVITIIGSRNMWVGAQENVKAMLADVGAKLVGNISLRDKHHNLPSVVTIIYWMTSGKKNRLWGIFPLPGISDRDIDEAERFGYPILKAIETGQYNDLQEKLLALKSVEIIPSVLSMERKGKKIFRIWSKFIRKKGEPGNPGRIPRLKMFKWYLLFVIFVVSPIVTLFFYITYPLFFMKIRKNLKYYSGVGFKN